MTREHVAEAVHIIKSIPNISLRYEGNARPIYKLVNLLFRCRHVCKVRLHPMNSVMLNKMLLLNRATEVRLCTNDPCRLARVSDDKP